MEASALRTEKIRRRSQLSVQERCEKSRQIAEKLFGSPMWEKADILLVYMSYGAEAGTAPIIERAFAQKKRVFCPRVAGAEMEFYEIRKLTDCKAGFRGILEPAGTAKGFLELAAAHPLLTQTLLLAPGTVFDLSGGRIGYGGGYYDRYLSKFPPENRPMYASICFQCQLTEHLELQAHDIRMDAVFFA